MAEAVVPITLDEAKQHLRIYHNEQDDLIALKLSQAIKIVEEYCNHSMAEVEIVKEYDGFNPKGFPIDILPGPVSAVSKVEYLASISDIAFTELDESKYRLVSSGMRYGIRPITSWPSVANVPGSVKITFTSGYSSKESIPYQLIAGAFIVLSNLYENPGDQIIGIISSQLEKGLEFVLSSVKFRNV